MSLGGDTALDKTSSPNAIGNGNGNGNNIDTAGRPATPEDATAKAVRDVTSSEIGISTLLNRLKQSIASAKEFASFLKKRSAMEEEHSNGLKKLCKATGDSIRKPEHRHGSTGRIPVSSRAACCDTEAAMRKFKVKYDALADEYDRARTGDRQSGKIFGLKGPKSAAQHEEDLLRKQGRGGESARRSHSRVRLCIDLQMQKFASFNEKLLLSNGLNISPIRAKEQGTSNRSLREAVHAIDNVKDLSNYISSFAGKVPSRVTEIKYERNTVLQPSQNIAHASVPSGPPSGSPLGPPPGAAFSPGPVPNSGNNTHLAPLKPVFGLSLEELFERDGSAVSMIVYQCIQAVDLFGLEVEGIYRLSGTASHIMKIKAMFDNDASKVDFRNPESFFHDVNSVAGLLKQFFRELPDPLLTVEQYPAFIEAAKHDDEIVRRDSLHAIINGLPDPNYATLRALTLHLNRVQESSASNRMNASNLAIVFGPTLMGANTGPNIQDAGWQVRVIHTILDNTYQIFDDD
ncbi:hypothetical protein DID88_007092 [Monilinia fructigena]|uniref:Rho-GAP domain-containing protein n=1 Tax=Monilinia fructigena TaxID=38457 RepID=A0A395J7P8_9HELO|nr:hypothetical protein DID88_007092 [Monilinia fructigena]